MTLQTAFFAFPYAQSEAKELNQTLSLVRDRFTGTDQRIINVETVQPITFLGLKLKAGGLRVWYESTD
ncbi:hypothetical protein [Pseudomonas sp.]|uniref:hypothetical protein n=1 Tax=Pseudomonas sp. TaxID=306 RepID=UPI003FD8379A